MYSNRQKAIVAAAAMSPRSVSLQKSIGIQREIRRHRLQFKTGTHVDRCRATAEPIVERGAA